MEETHSSLQLCRAGCGIVSLKLEILLAVNPDHVLCVVRFNLDLAAIAQGGVAGFYEIADRIGFNRRQFAGCVIKQIVVRPIVFFPGVRVDARGAELLAFRQYLDAAIVPSNIED